MKITTKDNRLVDLGADALEAGAWNIVMFIDADEAGAPDVDHAGIRKMRRC